MHKFLKRLDVTTGIIILTLLFFIIPLSNLIQATDLGFVYLKKYNCMQCHNYTYTPESIGPSFDEIRLRYTTNGFYDRILISILAHKLRNGGVGAWGSVPKLPTNLHRHESEYLIQFILQERYRNNAN